MKVYGSYLQYMKVYEGIWKYMDVYKVYLDILKNSSRRVGKGREGKGAEGKRGREGKGSKGKGREGKARKGKGREGKGRKGREGSTAASVPPNVFQQLSKSFAEVCQQSLKRPSKKHVGTIIGTQIDPKA